VVAAFSGLTDMDAITLSSAQMVNEGRIGVDVGWRMILIGAMANFVFKTAVVAVLGSRAMFLRVALASLLCIGGGVAILVFWPPLG